MCDPIHGNDHHHCARTPNVIYSDSVLVEKMIAPLFEANTYIMAPRDSQQALVVDPGQGHVQAIKDMLDSYGLHVAAVVCTHGHPDHVWDAARVAGDAPVYIPKKDAEWFDEEFCATDPLSMFVRNSVSYPQERPTNLVELGYEAASAGFTPVEGITMRMVPAPGHSKGSALFLFNGDITRGNVSERVGGAHLHALGGDVIFAGSIGRTDLAGGDEREMMNSLRTLQQVIDPQTTLLTGHGPLTTMGHEKQSNPFLAQARYQG